MQSTGHSNTGILAKAAALLVVLGTSATALAQTPSVEIYGFGQADAIIDFNQNNPSWYDTSRPSRLPSFEDEFGKDGHFYLSARQSRFGVKASAPPASGPAFAQFEFDLFGVGVDAGQTTIRLRHAYGQWRTIGAGQTNSVFMDGDVFPNTLEYWGPNGMLYFRNVQVYWRPIDDGKTRATIAVENPGASGDGGVYADRIQLQNVTARFPMPDFTGEYRVGRNWGYVEGAGLIGQVKIDDNLDDGLDLNETATRWGISLSSNVKPTPNDTLRLQYVFGEGIANYFNDAPIDVAAKTTSDPSKPLEADALGIQGITAYLDHNWNSKYSTAIGYSRVDVDNSNAQSPSAYKAGQYVSANLLHTPAPNVMMGGELLWADRKNNSDGFSSSDLRLQFSFKYSFSQKFGG
jgi:hypothetical protein